MRKLIGAALIGVLLAGFGIGMSGCSDESSEKPRSRPKAREARPRRRRRRQTETSGKKSPGPREDSVTHRGVS